MLYLPNKYGNEKYQGLDYGIVNTTRPLAAVLSNDKVNLSYDEAAEDLEQIFSHIPEDYFIRYGGLADFYYNFDCFRSPRQYDFGDEGSSYLKAAYRILFHNAGLFAKHQINNFAESTGMNKIFDLPDMQAEDWTNNTSKGAAGWFEWIWDYFNIGRADILSYSETVGIAQLKDIFGDGIAAGMAKLYELGWKYSGHAKMICLVISIIVTCTAWIRREWLFSTMGVLILGILFVVICMAPCMRENYYYSSFYNQYVYLMAYAVYRQNRRRMVEKGSCLYEQN